MSVTPSQVARFRSLVARTFGWQLEEGVSETVADLLWERANASGRSVDAYLALGIDDVERRVLARRLTVTETYFFRMADQLRAFCEVALHRPTAPRRREPLRVLSAGCASGEEPYSIAILAREHATELDHGVEIRGIDVNPDMLERAAAGVYSSWALRETPLPLRQRWFRGADGRSFRLAREIQKSVRFEEGNLLDDDLFVPESFDVVFCRNVLMYFSTDAAREVVAKLARSLAPGGLLFLGHAENLRGLSQDFHLRHTHGAFYYERKTVARRASNLDVARLAEDLRSHGTSWFDTIRESADRVSSLEARADAMTSTTVRPAAAPGWNLGPALELLGRERFSEARALLGGLPSEASRDPDVLLLRAVLLTHGDDLLAARAACDELLLLDEMSAGAHYLAALCREASGDLEAAAGHDRRAIHLDPDFAMPHLHLGRLERRAGRIVEARALLRRARDLIEREDPSRVLLFGGGFRREALAALCRAELVACGEPS